jgi:uncharacterized membrane protein YhiD involved in acid resistance
MELNETIVIGFLVVVILILIFSKISVKLNSDNNDSDSSKSKNDYNDKRTKRMNNNRNNANNDNNNTKSSDYDLKTSGLLSNDFKKQLDEIENKFYTSSCSINK